MKAIALIPARLESTRMPRKLLRLLGGITVLQRTCEAVQATGLFERVLAVCDHEALTEPLQKAGLEFMLSARTHESGTDRIAEAAAALDEPLIVNVQADEPFVTRGVLAPVLELLHREEVDIASLKTRLTDPDQIRDPNRVKVVTNAEGRALYFSRAPIPFDRDGKGMAQWFQHVGVYGFRREALLRFAALPPSPLEQVERLENLRMLEHGFRVYLAEIGHAGIAIDTEEDLLRAEKWLRSR
jgi:3-deoxy-manno-octulosonate cytidylyltransferase (CMP-KDO synthetase)